MENKQKFRWSMYFKASMIGALTKNLILPFEHPFELFKTKIQSVSNNKMSFSETIKFLR